MKFKFNTNCVNCFAGLSCGVRLEIVNLLKNKNSLSVMQIVKHFKLTQPTITHHLQYLEKSGLISSRRKGRQILYSIDPKCSEKCGLF